MSGETGDSSKSSLCSDYGSKPKQGYLEERRLSCSRTEFRPIHSEIIRRNLLKNFERHGSLPSSLPSTDCREDVLEEEVEAAEDDLMRRLLSKRLEIRRNSIPISIEKTMRRSDSGIGSSPEAVTPDPGKQDPRKPDLMFDIEM